MPPKPLTPAQLAVKANADFLLSVIRNSMLYYAEDKYLQSTAEWKKAMEFLNAKDQEKEEAVKKAIDDTVKACGVVPAEELSFEEFKKKFPSKHSQE